MIACKYNLRIVSTYLHILHFRLAFIFKYLFLIFVLGFLFIGKVDAQEPIPGQEGDTSFTYDVFPVFVLIEGVGNFYLDVFYTSNDLLYVNVEDLFKTLSIPCFVGQKGDSLGGFIENESRPYIIDFKAKQVKVGSKTVNTKEGLKKDMGAIYMESSLFAEAFGITMTFNYRALAIILVSSFELPILKQQRLERMRNNLSKLKGEVVADTIMKRNYHLFKFGTLDWSIASSQTWDGSTDDRCKLSLGTELLFGEADVNLDYFDKYKFDNRQLQYIWRWVDNDIKIIKQAQLGKISTQMIAFANAPMIGAVVRNAPTTIRKASGYYIINDHTEPNWTVELYMNNTLVDYTKADASGLYIFKVPIIYGYTTLKLKFYGLLGEERTEERTLNVPYTVMPSKEFEYGLSAGFLQDDNSTRFGKFDFNYGVNRFFTIGGGLEYMSSIPKNPFITFLKASIQPFSKLTLNGEYDHGVKYRALLNYYITKSISLEVDYIKYAKGQVATRFNALEERKAKISVPFRIRKTSGHIKLDCSQLVYNAFLYTQGDVLISVFYQQFSANSSTQVNWVNEMVSNVITDLSLSYRLGRGFNIRSSAQYNINESKLVTCKLSLEKSIMKGYLMANYERNFLYNSNFINVGFKFDLSFTKINVSSLWNDNKIVTSESADGSIAFGGGGNYAHINNNSSIGKGGVKLYPFLDLNNNGIFDEGERMVKLATIKINGGNTILREKDSIVRIPGLNAFVNYNIEVNENDLENIAWRIKKKVYSVLIDPNQFKRIDIPIVSVGEVSGTAYMNKDNVLKGIGRILIKFYKKNSDKAIAETLSESDGYIYYIGLAPGDYVARVDANQLKNLDFVVDTPEINFTIKPSENGDIVEGINFTLNNRTVH